MARTDGIEDRFEAFLRGRIQERNRADRGDCPEVATIAAYCERSLARDERDAVERHLSGCVACRAELAAIARAARELEAAPAPQSRLDRWWSSVPIGLAVAGGIAVVVAIGLGRDYYNQEAPRPAQPPMQMASRSLDELKDQAARRDANRIAPKVQLEANAPEAALPARAAPRAMRAPQQKAEQLAAPPETGGAASEMMAREAPPPPGSELAKSERDVTGAQAGATGSAIGETGATKLSASPHLAAPFAGGPAAAPAGTLNSYVASGRASNVAPPPTIPSGAGAGTGMIVGREGVGEAPGGSAQQESAPTFARPWPHSSVSSPDGSVRWDFGRGGMIGRYVSTGVTSIRVPGVTVDLLAGSAPSSSVCWIVGRGGTVLRTIDGLHWEKLNSPTAADLTAVTAQGADAAIVTAQDSQRYATSDGGQTWQAQ